jgi:hypothetical protein
MPLMRSHPRTALPGSLFKPVEPRVRMVFAPRSFQYGEQVK